MKDRPVLTLVRWLPAVAPWLTAAVAVLIVLQVAAEAATVLSIGRLTTDLAALANGGLQSAVMIDLALVASCVVLDVAAKPVRDLATSRLGSAADWTAEQLTVEGVLRPAGIAHLDDPAVVDRIEVARTVGLDGLPPRYAVVSLAGIVTLRLGAAGSAVMLAWSAGWWASVLLSAVWLYTGRKRDLRAAQAFTAHSGQTSALRRAGYLRDLALNREAAKEIRIFGLPSWLVDRFTTAWWEGMAELRSAGTGRRSVSGLLLLVVGHLLVLVPLLRAGAQGETPVGQTVVALQSLLGLAALGWTADAQWMLRSASAAVPAALEVAALGRDEVLPARPGASAAGLPQTGIGLHQVTFRYPGDARPVLDGVTLDIPAGSSLALVGDNGAGKSTITKLLGGLYHPCGGRITVDGRDLAEYDLDSWRRNLAMVFQDFVHYPLSARENVAAAFPEIPADPALLIRAARSAGFDAVVSDLPRGWETVLDPAYTGGTGLSGGQWQRLALARALYAVAQGARVLVLDEPTAHLDIRIEHELYRRFLELTAGLTTILVSHRFATVRLADRIAVLSSGRISEIGSHDELIAAGGRYARMFALQAAPFLAMEQDHG